MNNLIFEIQRFAQIYGTDSDDNIVNDRDNVTINALAGNDTVDNIGSNVAVYGGTGNDSLHNNGSDYSSRISNITLDGGDGNDYISNNSYTSNVLINGGNGRDYIWNYANNVTINAGADNDYIYNGGDTVSIGGDDGNDTINNSYGNNVTIDGGIGSDIVSISSSTSVTAFGGYGDDTIVIDRSNNLFVNGGAGNDSINIAGANDNVNTIVGGYGNDTITGGRGLHLYQYTEGDGNDLITDFNANDTLQIGNGTDTYNSIKSGSDIIVTVGDGYVTLTGAANLSTVTIAGTYVDPLLIIGTDYADTISNRLDNATIRALGGGDDIYNSGDNVFVSGGAGNDYIINGSSSGPYVHQSYTTILSGDGNDTVYNNYNGDYSFIDGGAGDDSIYSSDEDYSTINGGEGNDTIQGNYWSSSLNGGSGNDLINVLGGGSDNTINGGDGDDTISNNANYALIYGGAGNDTIINDGTNAYINGGTGKDLISLGSYASNNLIQYTSDDGNDIINGFNETSTLQIGNGTGTYSSVASNSDVVITVGDGKVTLEGAAGLSAVNIAGTYVDPLLLVGTEGADYIVKSLDGATIQALGGNDTIINGGNDVLIYGGSGNDLITNAGASAYITDGEGNDTIQNNGVAYINLTAGNDYVINSGQNTASTVQVDADATGKKVINLSDVGDFVVVDEAAARNNSVNIISGAGNDSIFVRNDVKTTIDMSKGGVDVVSTWGGANARVTLDNYDAATGAGIKVDEIGATVVAEAIDNGTIVLNNGNVEINGTDGTSEFEIGQDATGGTIVNLIGAYSDKALVGFTGKKGGAVDVSTFTNDAILIGNMDGKKSKGSTLTGGAGNDRIYAGKNDVINAGAGNDTISNSGSGKLLIHYSEGDGDDSIIGFDSKSTLQIGNGTGTYSKQTSGNDVIITVGDDYVTLTGATSLSTLNIAGTESLPGPKTLYLDDSDKSPVTLSSDYQHADASARVRKAIKIAGNEQDNSIIGGDKNDSLVGKDGNDTLIGGLGNDTFTGGNGNDLFVYTAGNDVVTDYVSGQDTIKFESVITNVSVKSSDVIFTTDDGKITVKNSKGKTINYIDVDGNASVYPTTSPPPPTVCVSLNSAKTAAEIFECYNKDIFYAPEWGTRIKSIDASATTHDLEIIGNETVASKIIGGDGDNILYGSTKNDTFTGGVGNDTFVYSGGNDTITDYTEDEDIIDIESGAAYSKASVKGNDVIFTVGKNKITVKDAADKVITFSDGTIYPDDSETSVTLTNSDPSPYILGATIETVDGTKRTKAIEIFGNDLANSIVSGSKNDSIYGGDGDDTLNGGKGNDTITGGDGNDVFVYTAGKDVITDYNEDEDIIRLATGTIKNASAEGSNVIFKIGSGTLTVNDAAGKTLNMIDSKGNEYSMIIGGGEEPPEPPVSLNAAGTAIKIFEGYTADSFDAADYGSKLKTIDGSATTHDFEIIGNGLANSIIGGSGDNILIGGKGNDKLWGNEGNDTFIYEDGDGKDIIYGFEDGDLLQITGDFSAKFNQSKNEIAFKVGTTSNAITLKEFDATIFNINGDSYQISGTKLVKK